jgi:CRISPR-associated protein Csb1
MSANVTLTLQQLQAAVAGTAAAFRSITKLEPAAGPDAKIFPATYSQAKYLAEKRRIQLDGQGEREVECVLIDSVQSQANRCEEALLDAVRAGRLQLPIIAIDFGEINPTLRKPLDNITSLQAPHRLADAILRDSVLPDGTRFSKSNYSKRWGASSPWNATAVYQLAPHALVFGLWGSPEKPGGLGAKFERTIASEIVAIDTLRVESRTGFRIDPCGASRSVGVIPKEDGTFEVKDGKGALRPSEINHGNILFDTPNAGIRCRYLEQTTVISLPALRRLRFPLDGNRSDPAIDGAARTVLAALGLCATTLMVEGGMNLRSRCLLHPTHPRRWELVDRPGETPQEFSFDAENSISLLNAAVAAAEKAGLIWQKDPITLKPSEEFAKLIQKSQEREAAESGEEKGS